MASIKIPKTLGEADQAIINMQRIRDQLATDEGHRLMRCARAAGFDTQRVSDEVLVACFKSFSVVQSKSRLADTVPDHAVKPNGKSVAALKAKESANAD